jgi:nucleotide-binding universal stress UspA family protein
MNSNKVIGCIYGTETSATVCEYAVWSALRMGSPLEFLHVLDRHQEVAPVSDFSGNLKIGAQEDLLRQLAELDAQRSKLAQEHGRMLIDAARGRAAELGVKAPEGRQRHGTLVETMGEMEDTTRLIVLGRRHVGQGAADQPVQNHRLERVIRAIHKPILATAVHYKTPERFMIAFDGSPTGRKTVERVAASPLLAGLPCHIVSVGNGAAVRDAQAWAQTELSGKGFEVTLACRDGSPENVLAEYAAAHAMDMVVIGAYGHSRIRHLMIGSTTTNLLRSLPVPVLVLR